MTIISHKKQKSRAYENLWLMTQCNHFIISQGTYHWWGAWLGKNQNKKIIVPNPKLIGISEDYFPESWIKINAT